MFIRLKDLLLKVQPNPSVVYLFPTTIYYYVFPASSLPPPYYYVFVYLNSSHA